MSVQCAACVALAVARRARAPVHLVLLLQDAEAALANEGAPVSCDAALARAARDNPTDKAALTVARRSLGAAYAAHDQWLWDCGLIDRAAVAPSQAAAFQRRRRPPAAWLPPPCAACASSDPAGSRTVRAPPGPGVGR